MPETMPVGTAAVLTFGEMLFDELPDGLRPGGGPFNAAAQLAALGQTVALISAVGEDSRGKELLQVAAAHRIDTTLIQESYLESGRVSVSFEQPGEPVYDIVAPVAWDLIRYEPGSSSAQLLDQYALHSKAIAFWLLGMRSEVSRKALLGVLAKAPVETLRMLDIGLRQNFYDRDGVDLALRLSDIVKCNAGELQEISALLGLHSQTDLKAMMATLVNEYQLDTLIITQGPEGALSLREGVFRQVGSPKVEVVDTIGCGDAFLAGYLNARLHGLEEEICLKEGCRRGASAAQHPGGLPPLPSGS